MTRHCPFCRRRLVLVWYEDVVTEERHPVLECPMHGYVPVARLGRFKEDEERVCEK